LGNVALYVDDLCSRDAALTRLTGAATKSAVSGTCRLGEGLRKPYRRNAALLPKRFRWQRFLFLAVLRNMSYPKAIS